MPCVGTHRDTVMVKIVNVIQGDRVKYTFMMTDNSKLVTEM